MQIKPILLVFILVSSYLAIIAQNNMEIIAQINGEHHRSRFGMSLASLDFNHDSIDDLIVCASNYGYVYPSTPGRGKVYVYYGGVGFDSDVQPAMTIEGTHTGTTGRIISCIENIGDVNGDGFDDLCIIDYDPSVSVDRIMSIYYGNCSDFDNPDMVITLPGGYMFLAATSLGDLNGDGYDEIGFNYTSYQAGKCLDVIWGGSFTRLTVSSGEGSPSYNSSIHGIGDINNDGFDDFATGFVFSNSNPFVNHVRLYYGNAEGDISNPIVLINTQASINNHSKPLGDMNADGYDDFMGYISSNGMHVWLGGQSINIANPNYYLNPIWYGDLFVSSLVYGDFNNDGYSDVIGADSYQKKFSLWLGRIYVNGTSDFIYHRPGSTNFGYCLTAGDFNADGYDDIAVSAPFENDPPPEGTFYGFVWVHSGNADLADTSVSNDDPVTPQIGDQLILRISPNPAYRKNAAISIRISGLGNNESTQSKIEVFNIRGQLVSAQTVEIHRQDPVLSLPISILPSGIYYCKVKLGDKISVTKFCVME